jgi:hypothetical protein
MTERLSYRLTPGDHVNLINEKEAAIQVKLVTACGAEIVSSLHPGARLEMTVGTMPVEIFMLDEGPPGLPLVR